MVGTNAPSAQGGAAQHVGGARTSVPRRRFGNSGSNSASAASAARPRSAAAPASQGIMRFYTEDAPGLKIGPATVLIMAFCFMGSVVLLHILGKITQNIAGSD